MRIFNAKNKNFKELIKKLLTQTFTKNGKKLQFAYWTTDKISKGLRVFDFHFNEHGGLYEPTTGVRLYNQHLDDYKNSFSLIEQSLTDDKK